MEVGELHDRGASPLFAGLGEGGLPAFLVERDAADCRVGAGVRAGSDRETNVAFPAPPHEGGASGRIGSYLHRPLHEAGIVATAVPDSDLWREVEGPAAGRCPCQREGLAEIVEGAWRRGGIDMLTCHQGS